MGDPARDASSDPDTVETECARGSRLPRIVGGEEELGGPSLAPEQCACEMKGVERLHRRRFTGVAIGSAARPSTRRVRRMRSIVRSMAASAA